ncbi:MAG: hypothetical protein KatS3mg108_0620 [Isosphaeraceae bacterium]|nr:MAG: hypothetical protein KatS3mg108_0620 [Isosphaeraceae bacterium]
MACRILVRVMRRESQERLLERTFGRAAWIDRDRDLVDPGRDLSLELRSHPANTIRLVHKAFYHG